MKEIDTVCYMGDTGPDRAGIYLAGIMSYYGIPYEYTASCDAPDPDFTGRRHSLYVLSDYPSARFSQAQLEHISACTVSGSGLLMIGGWESFHGEKGEYNRSPLKEALPVVMQESDDRRNFPQPAVVRRKNSHVILDGLPWHTPPCIGGLNAFFGKRGTQTLLEVVRFDVRIQGENVADCSVDGICEIDGRPLIERASVEHSSGDTFAFSPVETIPLLVVGEFGTGRTAAFASDVAPHWVGGLVDWGKERISQKVINGEGIEVGKSYAEFFRNLIQWTAGKTPGAKTW